MFVTLWLSHLTQVHYLTPKQVQRYLCNVNTYAEINHLPSPASASDGPAGGSIALSPEMQKDLSQLHLSSFYNYFYILSRSFKKSQLWKQNEHLKDKYLALSARLSLILPWEPQVRVPALGGRGFPRTQPWAQQPTLPGLLQPLPGSAQPGPAPSMGQGAGESFPWIPSFCCMSQPWLGFTQLGLFAGWIK